MKNELNIYKGEIKLRSSIQQPQYLIGYAL